MSTTKEQEQQGLMAIKNIPELVEGKKAALKRILRARKILWKKIQGMILAAV